jgi:hypothetical protein
VSDYSQTEAAKASGTRSGIGVLPLHHQPKGRAGAMLLPFPSGTRRYIALLDVRDFEGISIGRSVPVALLVAGQVEEGGTL